MGDGRRIIDLPEAEQAAIKAAVKRKAQDEGNPAPDGERPTGSDYEGKRYLAG